MISFCKIFYTSFIELLVLFYFLYRYFMGSDPNVSSEDELAQIQRRMAEVGITNAGAYMRKMALNGYILHVDLAPVKELVSLQRRCANNLNQVAVHANTFGVYPEEVAGLQRDYEKLWGRVSDVLTELSVLVEK